MGGEFYINRHNEHLISQYLGNLNKSILVDFTKDSDTLLISFSGRGRIPTKPPVFELFRSTQEMGVNRILIRDLKRAWFHEGLVNIPEVERFDDIVAYLEDIIPADRFQNIIVIGLSMGGYAALLFGLLTRLKVTVHAFGPQTFLDKDEKKYTDATRWICEHLNALSCDIPLNYIDLVNVFLDRGKKPAQPHNEFHIHYGEPDKVYTERLRGLEGIHLYEYDIQQHDLLVYFKEKGELLPLLNTLFFTPASAWDLNHYQAVRA